MDLIRSVRAFSSPAVPGGSIDRRIVGDSLAVTSDERPTRLLGAWLAAQIGAATAALLAVAALAPIRPDIALPWPGLPADLALYCGLGFWLVFGLVGGVRARFRAGGGVMTFSMPFIIAGTLLGGPVAGGLMGLISELEVREIRTQPWYGVVANHAVSMLAAIAAALVGEPARVWLEHLLPGQAPLAFFATAMVMALVFDTVNLVLVVPTLALRHRLTIREASRSQDATFRATAVAEGILAWNMAAGYLALGWWAPVASVVLVLIVWQAYDRGEALRRDPKTRLLNDVGLRPRLEAAIESARRGRRGYAFLLLDLDGFKRINDTYLYEAGDEVLVATARRLLTAVRATDVVARMNRAGDEFAILFDSVADAEMACRLAQRIQDRIAAPIHLRSVEAEVAVNASIGIVLIERGTLTSADVVLELADARMVTGKALGSGIVVQGDNDAAALERRLAAGPRRSTP